MPALALYQSFSKAIADGTFDLDGAGISTLYASMHGVGYTPDAASHSVGSSLTSEVSGTGYTAGGNAVTIASFTRTNNQTKLMVSNPTWTITGTVSPRYLVIRKGTGAIGASDPLVGYIDLGAAYTITAQVVTWELLGGYLLQVQTV